MTARPTHAKELNAIITIKKYTHADDDRLFAMMEREGDEWAGSWRGDNRAKYQKALANSVVYLIFEGETLCGFVRCRDDDGFGVYVYDLLVDKNYRGKEYGRMLMEQCVVIFPTVRCML